MSYILDALKKSEQERKLGKFPDINSEHQSVYRENNNDFLIKLALSLSIALFILSIALLYLYIDSRQSADKAVSPRSTQESSTTHVQLQKINPNNDKAYPGQEISETNITANRTDTPAISGFEVIRPDSQRRESLKSDIKQQENQEARIKAQYEAYFADNPEEETAANTDEPAGEKKDNKVQDERAALTDMGMEVDWYDYPAISGLSPDIQKQLPALKVSTHIYSPARNYRKVTVNGVSAREGETIGDKLLVEHITEEGLVLKYHDQHFRMKALEQWQGVNQ